MGTKRLVILVEGDSELSFIQRLVIPKLYSNSKGCWSIETCKIITNRKKNKKGGNISFNYLYNDVERFSAQGCSIITTFLDFFRLPTDFPGYTTDGNRIGNIENAIKQELEKIPNAPKILPYIQKYEFETLLFSNMDGFNYLLDEDKKDVLDAIQQIINQYPNPENINGGKETAPSKRLINLFPYKITVLGAKKVNFCVLN